MYLFEVIAEGLAALRVERLLHDVCSDERIAVAVAADPRAGPQEGGQRCADEIFDTVVQAGHLAQEGGVVVGQGVVDLVHHRKLELTQHARLPEDQHRTPQRLIVFGQFVGGECQPVAGVEQLRDLPLAVEDALALDLGRMRGQYRGDLGAGEEAGELRLVDAEGVGARDGEGEAARTGLGAGQRMRARAADAMLVLGDIGEVREIAERPHHEIGLFAREGVEDFVEFAPGIRILFPMLADRQQANALDEIEDRIAFLIADDIAQQAAEQADVLEQGSVLVVCPRGGLGWGRDARICLY